jgi:Tfp pilus assembly protein FimT
MTVCIVPGGQTLPGSSGSETMDLKKSCAGFGMVELTVVMLLATVMAGAAILTMGEILSRVQADEAMNQTVAQLRGAREEAFARRRNVEVRFIGDTQIQLIRQDRPAGTTVLSTVTLRNGSAFRLYGGLPDTPDGFGNSSAVDFGGSARLLFLSDGTLVDTQGNPLNGSVYLGMAGRPETARAVTILGATGRVRNYRWTGNEWHH